MSDDVKRPKRFGKEKFAAMPERILDDRGLTFLDWRVLTIIALYGGKGGSCYHSQKEMADRIHASLKRFTKSVSKLCARNYVTRDRLKSDRRRWGYDINYKGAAEGTNQEEQIGAISEQIGAISEQIGARHNLQAIESTGNALPTRPSILDPSTRPKEREEGASPLPLEGKKEEGNQEKRAEILKSFYDRLPLAYHKTFNPEILEQAADAELNGGEWDGVILLARHHDTMKAKGGR